MRTEWRRKFWGARGALIGAGRGALIGDHAVGHAGMMSYSTKVAVDSVVPKRNVLFLCRRGRVLRKRAIEDGVLQEDSDRGRCDLPPNLDCRGVTRGRQAISSDIDVVAWTSVKLSVFERNISLKTEKRNWIQE